jgi:uncharacterized protein YnzC (UPF0291/DUF896 family)
MLKNSIVLTGLPCSATEATHRILKEVRSQDTEHHVVESSNREVHAGEVAEATSVLKNTDKTEQEREQIHNLRRQLIAILKAYFFVTEDVIEYVSPPVDITSEKLNRIFETLRKLRFERVEEIRHLQDKVHSQYYHCLTYRNHLADMPADSLLKYELAGRLARARSYYANMKNHLEDMSGDTDNQLLAQALGIPKGVVDSACRR